jgi:hypothetical protein
MGTQSTYGVCCIIKGTRVSTGTERLARNAHLRAVLKKSGEPSVDFRPGEGGQYLAEV